MCVRSTVAWAPSAQGTRRSDDARPVPACSTPLVAAPEQAPQGLRRQRGGRRRAHRCNCRCRRPRAGDGRPDDDHRLGLHRARVGVPAGGRLIAVDDRGSGNDAAGDDRSPATAPATTLPLTYTVAAVIDGDTIDVVASDGSGGLPCAHDRHRRSRDRVVRGGRRHVDVDVAGPGPAGHPHVGR